NHDGREMARAADLPAMLVMVTGSRVGRRAQDLLGADETAVVVLVWCLASVVSLSPCRFYRRPTRIGMGGTSHSAPDCSRHGGSAKESKNKSTPANWQ